MKSPLLRRSRAKAEDTGLLRALQQELARAWVAGDRAAIERTMAPEWKTTVAMAGGKRCRRMPALSSEMDAS